MTREEKELLLIDLSARLHYGVMISHRGLVRPLFSVSPTQHFHITLDNAIDGEHNGLVYVSLDNVADDVKSYLRPMSSMTEEEVTELAYKVFQQPDIDIIRRWVFENKLHPYIDGNPVMVIDWLNAHHFDYRGLIEKGLAIEAPEGMYEIQN